MVKLLPWMVLLSCQRPEAPSLPASPARPVFRTNGNLGHDAAAFQPIGARLPRAPRAPAPPPAAPVTVVGQILPALDGGRYDPAHGTELLAALDALEGERAALGLAGLSLEQWLGTEAEAGLCEDIHVQIPLSFEGEAYEASLSVPWGNWLTQAPARERYALPEACREALLASAGDLDAAVGAGCSAEDALAHFPEGSDCSACLELDGDLGRCIEQERCAEQATRKVVAAGRTWSVLRAPTLMCAPGLLADTVLLVEGLEEDAALPAPYDHGSLGAMCIEVWDEGAGAPELACDIGTASGHSWGDALFSRVDHVRPVDGTGEAQVGRLSFLDRLEVEGTVIPYALLGENGATAVSAPVGSGPDAWGINPLELRPDGLDPLDPDQTQARDYIAAFALKTSTTINGIIVQPFNHNRCAEQDWTGPHADGSFACETPGAWSNNGWLDDASVAWWDQGAGTIYVLPLVTLASTGLPDPSVPGGIVPRILGSTTLADPEWEGCAWPETFVPDRVRMFDPQPATGGEGYASFDGQTWRFGKDGADGVIMGLATSQRREFCPPGG